MAAWLYRCDDNMSRWSLSFELNFNQRNDLKIITERVSPDNSKFYGELMIT